MLDKMRFAIARFDAMSLRERLLILTTAVVAVALPVVMYLIEPAQKSQNSLKTKLAKMESENALLVLELATLKAQKKPDPNLALQAHIERLRNQSAALASSIETKAARLVSPQEMLTLLEQLLSQQKGLQLVSLSKGAPTPFSPLLKQPDNPTAEKTLPTLYRHDLSLVVEGGYFDFLAYLEALEGLPKSFFWDELEYQVQEYPKAQIRLKVHTLSSEAGWLGV